MRKIIVLTIGICLSNSFLSLAEEINRNMNSVTDSGAEMNSTQTHKDPENGTSKTYYDENRQVVIKIMEEKIAGEASGVEKSNRMALHTCVSEEAGIRFACNPKWKLSRQGKTLAIQVSFIPKVEIIIEEDNLKLKFISDFSRTAISSLGRFEEGFDIQRIEHCNRETVNVTGYLKGDPDTKVLDLFMVDHNYLHSVQFTVKPKESWEEYEDLIKKIVNSLEFTKQKSGIKFHLEPTDENCEEIAE